MTWRSSQHQGHRLIELLTLNFADTAYQRKSTPAGRARKSAFSVFATSLAPSAVKWASCVEDARKVFVLSSWKPGTYDADRSLSTVVKPLIEHLSGTQWSRQLVACDSTSVDTTSPLWSLFSHELRILDFRVPDDSEQGPADYWMEKEKKVSKALGTVRDNLTSCRWIGSIPSTVQELGYMGLVGGWVVAEDGPTFREGSEKGVANMKSGKWAGILGWQDKSGERRAWGEEGTTGPGQDCLQSLGSIANGVGQRWHATRFEVLYGDPRFAFPSSDEDDP